MDPTVDNIEQAHIEALEAAQKAAQDSLNKHGELGCCGFAWVTIYDVKLSTKLGKKLKALGFSKAYGGGIEYWNPSKSHVQCLHTKELGANAYAATMRRLFPNMKIYAGSRMD